jgi:hypothetical protein
MATVFMTDPVTGRCALYDEPTTSGAADNPNSARNAPLNNPAANLAYLYFHSDFNYLEVAFGPTAVVVSHGAVAASSPPAGATVNFGWTGTVTDRLLFTHSLGYVPKVLAIVGNNTVWPGMPVQTGGGATRFVSIYATTTQVRMVEFVSTGSGTLPAVDLTYTLLVLADPPAATGNILFDFDPVTGIVEMGRRKFKSDRRYLQVVPGGSPFGISYGGKTIDLHNGAMRAFRPDGTYYEPVPAGLQLGLAQYDLYGTYYGISYGASMGYGGGYAGPGNIQVQAP